MQRLVQERFERLGIPQAVLEVKHTRCLPGVVRQGRQVALLQSALVEHLDTTLAVHQPSHSAALVL